MVLWPTGSTKTPTITDSYGPRKPICTDKGCTSAFHYGTDIFKPLGFRWRAPFAGKVIYSGLYGGWGYIVVIEGKVNGDRVQTAILHCQPEGLAKTGKKVAQGQEVATCGKTGQATGPHTCFRIWVNGNWRKNKGVVDTEKWIPRTNESIEEKEMLEALAKIQETVDWIKIRIGGSYKDKSLSVQIAELRADVEELKKRDAADIAAIAAANAAEQGRRLLNG